MSSAFDVKSTRFNALAFRLLTADTAALAAALRERAEKYKAFGSLPLVLDAGSLKQARQPDWAALLPLFAEHGLRVVGLCHRDRAWAKTASQLGLAFIPPDAGKADGGAEQSEAPQKTESDRPESVPSEHNAAPQQDAVPALSRPTVVVDAPVRTGQQVYAEKADLIVLGMVSEGAEVMADGNIHVYAPLRGRALAGESGNTAARIFAQSMQAELVSVAGIYRVFEQKLPPHLDKRPVLVELSGDGKLAVKAIAAD